MLITSDNSNYVLGIPHKLLVLISIYGKAC